MEEIKNEETLKEEESPKSENISQNEEPVTNENVAVSEEPQVIEETSDNKDISKNEEEQKKEKSHKIENINEKIRIFEPFLRVIEVIFIGILSIAIAINANKIANNQLMSEQMEHQPNFSLNMELTANDEGKEKTTESIFVEVTEGRAENISIETVTYLDIVYTFLSDTGEMDFDGKLSIRVDGYFGAHMRTGKNYGLIQKIFCENNYKTLKSLSKEITYHGNGYEEYHENLNKNGYCVEFLEWNTLVKITYTDYTKKIHSEYFKVDRLDQYHLDEKEGNKIYEKYRNLENSIDIIYTSAEHINSLIKSNISNNK